MLVHHESTSNATSKIGPLVTFTAAQNGDWNTGATWVGGVVPGTSDDKIIPAGINVTITTEVENYAIITNYGAINVTNTNNNSVGIYNSGTLTNSGRITIANTSEESIGIWNAGTLTSTSGGQIQVTNTNHGTLTNLGTGILNVGTLTNSGRITIANNDGTDGIDNLNTLGTLTNTSGGQIQVTNTGGTGILNQNGALTNSGTITVANTGNNSIGVYYNTVGTLTNSGTITVANTGIGSYGVFTSYTLLTNSGTITVSNTGALGIYNGVGSTITNSGTITVTNTGGTGIYNSGALTNSGTINITCTGTVLGTVPTSGNPVIFLPCLVTHLSQTIVYLGSSIHDSATLTGVTSNARGVMTYNFYLGFVSPNNLVFTSKVTVTHGIVQDSAPFVPTKTGFYRVQAIYTGDLNNKGAASKIGSESFQVIPGATVIVEKDTIGGDGTFNFVTNSTVAPSFSITTVNGIGITTLHNMPTNAGIALYEVGSSPHSHLTNLFCSSISGTNVIFLFPSSDAVTFNLGSFKSVIKCNFVNTLG